MEQIIECNNLTHYYGKRLIYENLSFTVPAKSGCSSKVMYNISL